MGLVLLLLSLCCCCCYCHVVIPCLEEGLATAGPSSASRLKLSVDGGSVLGRSQRRGSPRRSPCKGLATQVVSTHVGRSPSQRTFDGGSKLGESADAISQRRVRARQVSTPQPEPRAFAL